MKQQIEQDRKESVSGWFVHMLFVT